LTDTPPEAIRVFVVDDHPVVREGLRSILDNEGVTVVAEAGTGSEVLKRAADARADVILLDIQLPDLDGLAVLRRLREIAPDAAVVILTMHDEAALVRDAIAAGAAGYLLKGIGRRELLAAVFAVGGGESVVDPALLRAALQLSPPVEPEKSVQPSDSLTAVELDVLRLIAEGMTNRQISQRLRWSISTVKKYARRIFDKLGVDDRTEAVAVAVRGGLLADAPWRLDRW
jgi:DNA-binding NarL/FixJ family response regulator